MRRSLVRLIVLVAALSVLLTPPASEAQIGCDWEWVCAWPCLSGGWFGFINIEEMFARSCCDDNGDCWHEFESTGGCCY